MKQYNEKQGCACLYLKCISKDMSQIVQNAQLGRVPNCAGSNCYLNVIKI